MAMQLGGRLVLVAFGVAMITGWVSGFAIWPLDSGPALGRLG